jgi:hypothetical protein
MALVGQIYQKNELKFLPYFYDRFQQLSQNTKKLLIFKIFKSVFIAKFT